MENPCYWEGVLNCLPDCITGKTWENCQYGKLSPDYKESNKAKEYRSRLIRSAVLNKICETFNHDPEIMAKIEALNLEDVIKNLL